MTNQIDWSKFVTDPERKVEPKRDPKSGEPLPALPLHPNACDPASTQEFVDRHENTVKSLQDDPIHIISESLFAQMSLEVKEAEKFFQRLGQKYDTSRSDWLSLLDSATQQDLMERARRLNDLRDRLTAEEARNQQREKSLESRTGVKQRRQQMQIERDVISRLTEVLGQTNLLVNAMNPNYNQRPRM